MNSRKASAASMGCFLCVCVLLICVASAAFAQAGRGSVSGLVTDPSGAIVPSAKITLLNHATGISQHSLTTAAGLYTFVSLNPGVYQVTASMKGFENVAQDNVNVTVDQTSTVNITLRVGSVTDTVTVMESVDLLENSNSTVGQLISSETIDRVPMVSRDVFQLVQLSAGVTPANGSPNSSDTSGVFFQRPGADVSSYTINGAIEGSVYYMLDGSPLGIAENNVAAIIPAMQVPEDGVDEYRVETQNTPASYQSGGAGVISLVSKSGGDKFHGDAFVYIRPNVLAANDYFNKQAGNPTPNYHRYQEGGAISGPILHKKLFFYGDYEATQQASFDGSNLFTVPTTAERTGDFSADSFTIYNPMVPDVATGPLAGTRQPFAGNKITTVNPIAQAVLANFPKCNVSTTCDSSFSPDNLYLPGLDPINAKKFDVRLDYFRSEKQHIFARYSFDDLFFSDYNSFKSPWDLYYFQNITHGNNFLLADDLTLNSTTVLQLRYSFTRHYENQTGDPGQNAIDNLTTMGFPSSLAADETYKTLPYFTFNDYGNSELPGSDGIGGTANYNTFIFASENSDMNATLTRSWGKHEISAGAEYMKRFMNVGAPGAPSGNYGFDYSATDQTTGASSPVGGSDFASFLLGMGLAQGGESTNFTQDLFAAESSPYYAAFIQDTYHPNQHLTITAGLRWDIFGGKTERHNRLEYFDPTAADTVNNVAFTGGEVFATSGNRSPFTTNLTNFGPRLGFSWQPEKHLVVRGGGGFYFGPSAQMVGSAVLDSDGYNTATNWNATTWNGDSNTIAFDGGGQGNSIINSTTNCPNTGSVTGCYSLSDPFPTSTADPSGLVPLSGSTLGLGTNLGSPLSTMLHSQRTQETYNFNFGVEYEFPHNVVVSVGYVGSRGLFLPLSQVDLNQLPLSVIASRQASLFSSTVANTWENIQPNTNAYYGSSTVPLWLSLQPYPQFGSGNYGSGQGVNVHGYPGGDSEYSSLQSKVQKRMTQHFTTLVSFTWGKIITDDGNPPLDFLGSHAGTPQDWKNMNFEHAVSPQDVKYQFTAQASYDLPVGKGRALNLNGAANTILGGWTANGVFYLSTGVPIISPLVGASPSYFNQRMNLTCDPSKGAPHTAAVWFNPSCFALPASSFVPGTAPAYLDHVRTMGANDLDLTLSKDFKLGKERNIRFEVSSFNIANRPQFGAPSVPSYADYSSGNASFGSIGQDVNTPRQFQFASKFTF
ncbi:MAG: carboxypeptidase regulatory-like domain-containing protein [Terracidiphilus sp.]